MTVDRVISLAALTVLELSPPDMISVAARCGYTHVGLRPIAATPDEPHVPILTDASFRSETRRRLLDEGVAVLDIEILRLKPDTIIADFEAVMAFGAEMGARFALVAGNDPDRGRMAENFAALCMLGRGYGIRPHIEFMPWTDVPDLHIATRIADASGAQDAGILIDAFHLNRSGGRVEDIAAGNSRFGYVQLCDIAGPIPADMSEILREARSDRLFPGDGDCPIEALLARLSPTAPISLEVPAERLRRAGMSADERARRAIDATRALLDRMAAAT